MVRMLMCFHYYCAEELKSIDNHWILKQIQDLSVEVKT